MDKKKCDFGAKSAIFGKFGFLWQRSHEEQARYDAGNSGKFPFPWKKASDMTKKKRNQYQSLEEKEHTPNTIRNIFHFQCK